MTPARKFTDPALPNPRRWLVKRDGETVTTTRSRAAGLVYVWENDTKPFAHAKALDAADRITAGWGHIEAGPWRIELAPIDQR